MFYAALCSQCDLGTYGALYQHEHGPLRTKPRSNQHLWQLTNLFQGENSVLGENASAGLGAWAVCYQVLKCAGVL